MVSTDIVNSHKLFGLIHPARAHDLPIPMPCLLAPDLELACHESEPREILSWVPEGSNVDSPSAHPRGVVAALHITDPVGETRTGEFSKWRDAKSTTSPHSGAETGMDKLE